MLSFDGSGIDVDSARSFLYLR